MIESLQLLMDNNEPLEDEELEDAVKDTISELYIAKKAFEKNPFAIKRNRQSSRFGSRAFVGRPSYTGARPPNMLIEQILLNHSAKLKRDPFQKEGGNP
jgi:hypothetical protein